MEKDELVVPRRTLLAGAAAICAGALAARQVGASAGIAYADDASEDGVGDGVQYGFLMKTSRCAGCGECMAACRRFSGTADGADCRRRVVEHLNSEGESVFVSLSCMHCAKPSCLGVCPAGAISKGDGGIVTVDKDRCIGCKYCYQACPFNVPRYDDTGMDKCDCCVGNGVPVGEIPYCVEACIFGALRYGNIEALKAECDGRPQFVEAANGPSYLVM